MEQVILGRTGIITNKNGFGALPIQRVSTEYAGMLLKKAYCAGMTFFDTARSYSDSEEKIGLALSDVRQDMHTISTCAAEIPDQLFSILFDESPDLSIHLRRIFHIT